MWRLILEKVATLREIDEHWTIDDIADANEALDAKLEAEYRAAQLAQKGR